MLVGGMNAYKTDAYTLYLSTDTGTCMHKKIRGNIACLYRSSWVKKGAVGNMHGYAVQTYVGSIPVRATSIPYGLEEVLTADEHEYVVTSICMPAVEAAERLRQQVELRERDPCWRLEEAVRLIDEAVVRSSNWPVELANVAVVTASLAKVCVCDIGPEVLVGAGRADPLLDGWSITGAEATLADDCSATSRLESIG